MTIFNWPNGIGAATGEVLGTCAPLSMSGAVWFVSSATGSDSYAGADEAKPFATLSAALSAATAGDIIVLLSGHAETIASNLNMGGKIIIGTGTSGGVPTVELTRNAAAASILTADANGSEIRNVRFKESAQDCATARIAVTAASFRMLGCYVDCGAHDTGAALSFDSSGDSAEIADTTFVSVATSVTAQPAVAISSTAAIADLRLSGLVLDGGTVGWSNYYAMNLSTAAVTRMRAESISLLNGSDIRLHASTTGHLNVQTSTGASKVFW